MAKTRTVVSQKRPQFEKRILEERRPVTQTHFSDEWFVLLDVGLGESGIPHVSGVRVLASASSNAY